MHFRGTAQECPYSLIDTACSTMICNLKHTGSVPVMYNHISFIFSNTYHDSISSITIYHNHNNHQPHHNHFTTSPHHNTIQPTFTSLQYNMT